VTRLTIAGFSGANRAARPRLLGETVGVVSENQKTGRGSLRPWKQPLNVATVPTSAQRLTIYRMGRDTPSDTQYWLSWSTVVHAIRGFDPADTTEKTYYTGSGQPRWTDNIKALASAPYPTAARVLGVPAPATAPTVALAVNGTTGTNEDFFVVSTFVTDEGEESQPSAPSIAVTAKLGATINVSNLAAAPSGNYGITLRRIYCTQTNSSGVAEFLFASQIAIGSTSVTIDTGNLGEVLETEFWDPPPIDGHSLTACWNGFAAMASGKSVRFCVEETLYAWPIGFRILTDDLVVGMAAYDQTLVVLTTGAPYVVQGSTSAAMSAMRLSLDQSCASRRSVLGIGHGVVWASPDGLQYLGGTGPANLTANLMTRDDWQALNPSSMVCSRYENMLVVLYNDGAKKGFMLDPLNPLGIFYLNQGYDAMFRDTVTDQLYVLGVGNVQKWDGGAALMTARFVSKVFRQQTPTAFTCAQVIADTFTAVTLKFYRDGTLILTKTVTDRKPFRIPKGSRGVDWQVEITTQSDIDAVIMATSMAELDG
jgi:hypothetical protein